VTPAAAREYGHSHLDELIAHADAFQNEAILLIHFSARYRRADIVDALARKLPPSLQGRVTPLLEGYA
jgi:ribonuclease Z